MLTDQLAALTAQSYEGSWEVIVADNGSTDDTRAVVEGFADRLPVRVIDASQRPGAAFARNQAVRCSSGGLLLFLDDDDAVASRWVERMVAAFAAEVDVVTGGTSFDFEDRLEEPQPVEERWFLPAGSGCNLAVRRDVFEDVGGFDPAFRTSEDVDFCWRAQLRGFRFDRQPEAVLYRRMRQDLPGVWRQHFHYGVGESHLFKVYRRHGMQRELRKSAKVWAWALTRLPLLTRGDTRLVWVKVVAARVGRLAGSVKYRVIFP
jgi:GT2 family glycosyltransferase